MIQKSKADELRDRGDVAGLEHLMYHATDWLDGMDAAETLALMGNDSGIDYLLECLQDPDGEVRSVAIEIVQGLDNPRARQALREISLDSIYQIVQDDPDISLECGNCGNKIPTNARACPHCGFQLYGDKIRFASVKATKAAQSSPVTQLGNYPNKGFNALPNDVVVVDFDISFINLVKLLVKIALASIPALMILSVIIGLLFFFFGGAFVAFVSQLN